MGVGIKNSISIACHRDLSTPRLAHQRWTSDKRGSCQSYARHEFLTSRYEHDFSLFSDRGIRRIIMAKMLLASAQVDSESGQTTEVRNPATGEVVDTVPKG